MKAFHHLLQINIPWSMEHILGQVAPGTPPILTSCLGYFPYFPISTAPDFPIIILAALMTVTLKL